jgi:cell division protein FtsA
MELIRDRLREAGFGQILNRGVVLTGGASLLNGMQPLAQGILSRNVRLGRPVAVRGMPESANSPAFAAIAGLLIYPQVAGLEFLGTSRTGAQAAGGGYLSRVGRWLRESF